MAQSWGSTDWGQSFTATKSWQVALNETGLALQVGSSLRSVPYDQLEQVTATAGIIWSAVSIQLIGTEKISLDGIPNHHARDMVVTVKRAVAAFKAAQLRAATIKQLIDQLDDQIKPLMKWYQICATSLRSHHQQRSWITEETMQGLLAQRPSGPQLATVTQTLQEPEVKAHIATLSEDIRGATALWLTDLQKIVSQRNQKHLESEVLVNKDFFDRVEKSPLTEDQARAVVCFDNRVQIIASAGSGKTSTMVAKAGYALHREIVTADKILMLAFNAEAAKELQTRIRERLNPLGFPADQIVARTFHAFGLEVIGQATGKKPTLAPWLEQGGDIERLSHIVDQLKDRDRGFKARWDLFRVVFSRDLPKFGSKTEHEDWDSNTKETGYRTLRGEVVKSHEERMIADWLFYNGVNYQYEQPYQIDTANPRYRQYRPDFYYPDANAYHEHFALDAKGKPPAEFVDYMQGVIWKREIHAKSDTLLWETTSASMWSGKAFDMLAKNFAKAKVKLDPNPDRPIAGRRIIEHIDLVRTFRVFLTHAKSNNLSNKDLRERLKQEETSAFRFRHDMFLNLFESLRDEWEKGLREENVIDFEDMLNLAADHLETGRWTSPFELVMVDEFQDASRARARLTRGLVKQSGRFLCTVGDDWQSINRFAGADISVMTGFEEWFGKGHTLLLQRTFRCPQSLCNISSAFVQKNLTQIKKVVTSTQEEFSPAIQVFQAVDENKIRSGIETYLKSIYTNLKEGAISPRKNGRVEVFILGRYRRDSEFIPLQWENSFGDLINVKFMTIHGSKGLEADYVILPRLTRGAYGFPSRIEDDPVLQLAMPKSDAFPQAEERRLFYVALTRARRGVALFTVEHRVSEFVTELMQEHGLNSLASDGKPASTFICPKCKKGVMVPRKGKYGKFWGCSNFPTCKHSSKTLTDASGKLVHP